MPQPHNPPMRMPGPNQQPATVNAPQMLAAMVSSVSQMEITFATILAAIAANPTVFAPQQGVLAGLTTALLAQLETASTGLSSLQQQIAALS